MNKDAGDYALGARAPGGFKYAEDSVLFSTHSGTHIDALAHVWSGDTLYNGHPASSTRSGSGAGSLGAEKLKPIVTRGVLLDFVAATGAPLTASQPIGRAELEQAYERIGVTPQPGDAVLTRTGWWESKGAAGAEYFDLEPGISGEGALWLAQHDVAVVGADNYAVEVQPDPDGMTFPAHLELMHRHGVPLIENLDLTELAEAGATTFLFVLAPIPLEGSTAAPVTPLAVL
jgi:kynurenine formamidase